MFVSVNDHLFLALDRMTEQLDKLYNTDLLFGYDLHFSLTMFQSW